MNGAACTISRRGWLSTAAILSLAVASTVVAQDPRASLPASLSASTRNAVITLADSLTREGLPGQSLYSKAAEGVLKGASEASILDAVRSVATRLRDARRVVGPSASTAELEAGASALFAGVRAEELARLAALPRSGSLSLAYSLTVLADLVDHGVPSGRATESIELLAKRGAMDQDLTELRAVFRQELGMGESPTESLSRGTARVLRTIRPPSP